MEASSILVDTYKRYKKGCAIFVSWMATTSAKYQNIDHLLIKGPRLKGKARTEARQADGSIRHAKIPLSSFRDLAVILSKAGIKMSRDIEIILWDMIKARKECAAFYRYQPERSSEHIKTDEGHSTSSMPCSTFTPHSSVLVTTQSQLPKSTNRTCIAKIRQTSSNISIRKR